MSVSEKNKVINNKIEQNETQCNLGFLPEKDLLEKAAIMKRVEDSPLGKELKAQIDIAKKQYKKLHNTDEFVRIKKEIPTVKKCKKSNLIYNSRHSFYEYYNNELLSSKRVSLESKYLFLLSF